MKDALISTVGIALGRGHDKPIGRKLLLLEGKHSISPPVRGGRSEVFPGICVLCPLGE